MKYWINQEGIEVIKKYISQHFKNFSPLESSKTGSLAIESSDFLLSVPNDNLLPSSINLHVNIIPSEHLDNLKPKSSQRQIARRELQKILQNAKVKIDPNKVETFMKDMLLLRFPGGFDLIEGQKYSKSFIQKANVVFIHKAIQK
jgi:hypothetical protein